MGLARGLYENSDFGQFFMRGQDYKAMIIQHQFENFLRQKEADLREKESLLNQKAVDLANRQAERTLKMSTDREKALTDYLDFVSEPTPEEAGNPHQKRISSSASLSPAYQTKKRMLQTRLRTLGIHPEIFMAPDEVPLTEYERSIIQKNLAEAYQSTAMGNYYETGGKPTAQSTPASVQLFNIYKDLLAKSGLSPEEQSKKLMAFLEKDKADPMTQFLMALMGGGMPSGVPGETLVNPDSGGASGVSELDAVSAANGRK